MTNNHNLAPDNWLPPGAVRTSAERWRQLPVRTTALPPIAPRRDPRFGLLLWLVVVLALEVAVIGLATYLIIHFGWLS